MSDGPLSSLSGSAQIWAFWIEEGSLKLGTLCHKLIGPLVPLEEMGLSRRALPCGRP